MKKIILISIFLLIPQVVLAGVISLTTTVTTDIMTENATSVRVRLLNSGDESAHNVQVSLITDNFQSNPIFVGDLSPDNPFEGEFTLGLTKEILLGTYPLIVLVDYADANGYPFSSVSPTSIVYKTPTVSRVSGVMQELSLTGKETKTLTLTIRNLDDLSHDVDVKLILPRELKVTGDEKVISIQPKEEEELCFQVSSFSALPGSSYVVLASIEYDHDNSHYSSITRGMINIGEGDSSFLPDWLPYVGIIALAGIFIFYQFKGKKK